MINVVTDPFKSFEVASKNGTVRIDEGMKIKFCTESGESKTGVIKKIQGKGEKAKIQIIPSGSECEEVWSLIVMAENSLEVDKE
jgi:hypothetical protein